MIPRECEGPPAAESVRPAFSTGAASFGKGAVQAVYYAFVFLIPIETINTFNNASDSQVTFSRLLGLILFGLALINRRLCFRRIPAAFLMVTWYLVVYAFSQLWIPSSLDARFHENQATLIQMAALFLISANLFVDAEFREGLLRFYGWWVSLVAVGTLLGAFGGHILGTEGRSSILGQDPNVAAGYFALGAICIAGDPRIFASRRFLARFFTALFAISALIMAILQTGSRGGLLVFVSGILGLVICGGEATRKKRALIAGAVIGLLAVMVLREFQQDTATASRLVDAWSQGDTAGRKEIYKAAWTLFLKKPLLGYGGANNVFTLGVDLAYASGRTYFRDTHNLLLAVLTEVGLVGAVPFVAALFYALWKAWRYGRKTGSALPFALMGAQIMNNTSLTGYHQKLFWIVFAAAVACGLELDAAGKPGTAALTPPDPEAAAL